MALETSDLWKTLLKTPGTHRQYRFTLDGKEYMDDEVSHSVDSGLYETFSAGNTACAQLTLELQTDTTFSRGAEIKRDVRLVNPVTGQESEWLPAGVYHINRRRKDGEYWSLEAYDNMRLTEQPWNPPDTLSFPCPETLAVADMMKVIGCKLDPRTELNPSITVPYPTADPQGEKEGENYTIRQYLAWIAAGHVANWIVTARGEFLLLPLGCEPEETFFIVNEYGKAITFGGTKIVWRK